MAKNVALPDGFEVETMPDNNLPDGFEIDNTNNNFDYKVDKNGNVTLSTGIDYNNPVNNFYNGVVKGLTSIPRGMGEQFGRNITNEKIRPLFGQEPLSKERLDEIYSGQASDNSLYKLLTEPAQGVMGKTGQFIGEVAPFFILPEIKAAQGAGALSKVGSFLANSAVQGGIPFALDSLKEGNNPLVGAGYGIGTDIATKGVMGLTPWLAKNIISAFVDVKPETLSQVIKSDSKALDLTDEAADKLAADTTERFRNAYDTLKTQKGQVVQDMANKLTDLNKPIFQTPVETLKKYVSDIYDKAQVGRSNKLRRLAPKAEKIVNEEINAIEPDLQGVISPSELESLKQTIGGKIDWSKTDLDTQNQILEQVYGKMNKRLNALSPALANANKEYANLFDMLGQKSRLKTILSPKVDIETAISKMKNYKTTNDNIFDLEKQLVNELGEQPFLSAIDDVNAAKNLNESLKTGRDFVGLLKGTKEILLKPALFGIRGLNQTPVLPALSAGYKNIQNNLPKYLLGIEEALEQPKDNNK